MALEINYQEMFTTMLEKEGTVAQCFSVFHEFSINNQLLACWQLRAKGMDIQPVASKTRWLKVEREIKPSQKYNRIYLWQPIPSVYYTENEETGKMERHEYTRFEFNPRWYALEQTYNRNNEEFNPQKLEIKGFDLNRVIQHYKIKLIPFSKLNGNIQGYARVSTNELAINPVASDKDMTILHELAHLALEHGKVNMSTSLKELEAETVAYIVGSVIGATEEQLSNSRGYVQGWFRENKIPDDNANRIMKVADKILKLGLKKDKK